MSDTPIMDEAYNQAMDGRIGVTGIMNAACKLERELTAHKAALEKCEKAFYRVIDLCEDDPSDRLNRPKWLTEVIDEIAKLKGGGK